MIIDGKHFYTTKQIITYLKTQGKNDTEIMEILMSELGMKRMYAMTILNYESEEDDVIHNK